MSDTTSCIQLSFSFHFEDVYFALSYVNLHQETDILATTLDAEITMDWIVRWRWRRPPKSDVEENSEVTEGGEKGA